VSTIDALLDPVPIPRFVRVRQRFERPVLPDAEGELLARLRQRGVLEPVRPGWRVAIAVGSRGIANQPRLVRALARELRRLGAEPFLVPAMGSHGGATAAGQRELLERMGFTAELIGAPILSDMAVEEIGTAEGGLPVYIDRLAAQADGVVLVNRVKPHTSFRGPAESGLLKMAAIGLGKQKGADICHDLGFGAMAANVRAIARVVLARAGILFGVALVENAFHETCRIEVLGPREIEEREPALLEEARRLAPRLHFRSLEVLVIDEIGKEISGTGLDTNVVGRYHTAFGGESGLDVRRIVVLDLTPGSRGNGNGLGIADFTTRRVFEKLDFEQTYPNSLTTTVPASVKIPMVLKNDRQAVQAAVKTCNLRRKEEARIVRIRNTLRLEEIEAAVTLLAEMRENPLLTVLGEPYPLPFDSRGNLARR
jgi:hypothetical protein